MNVGDLVKGFVPIRWGEDVKKEDICYPGLKWVTGMIVDKNTKNKKVLVFIDDTMLWWDIKNVQLIEVVE